MITAFWRCESVGFAMQNSRFYRAKPTLLECKTIGFVKRWYIGCYTIITLVKNIYTIIVFFLCIKQVVFAWFLYCSATYNARLKQNLLHIRCKRNKCVLKLLFVYYFCWIIINLLFIQSFIVTFAVQFGSQQRLIGN